MARGTKKRPGKRTRTALSGAYLEVLRELALKHTTDTLEDLARRLERRTGELFHEDTIALALKAAKVGRARPGVAAADVDAPRDPHRFNGAHRSPGPEGGYPSSLTDAEWALVSDLFENEGGRGRPPKYPRRQMLDACAYVVRSGCAWRMLPKEFPKWQDVYMTFRRWTSKGLFEEMNSRLAAMWRLREGPEGEPTAAIIDSQSVRTSPQGGLLGYDAGKKVKGRKRHVVTDTLGLMLAVLITAASVQDRDAAVPTLTKARAKYEKLAMVYADSGYAGQCADRIRDAGFAVEIVRRGNRRGYWTDSAQLPLIATPEKPFQVHRKRWIIERTNAWNDAPRRQARDHDRRQDVSASWLWLGQARILLRRLAINAPA